jgi:hypothetical protein
MTARPWAYADGVSLTDTISFHQPPAETAATPVRPTRTR